MRLNKAISGRRVMIAGITSGIGEELAQFYVRDQASVCGTYRRADDANCIVAGASGYRVDVTDAASVEALHAELCDSGYQWDLLISCIGTLEPIGPFLSTNFQSWKCSFDTNYFGQLYLVHKLHTLHAPGATVVLFTGGAPNGVLPNFSAYSVAKIALTKMVEYLDAEDSEVKYVIIGPGWVNTKIHEQTLKAGVTAGSNLARTHDFLAEEKKWTQISEIYDCINWLTDQSKSIVGGRNYSVVWDAWGEREGSEKLKRHLADDPNLYKLRRYEESC